MSLNSASTFRASVTGLNGAGAITLTGAQVGDLVTFLLRNSNDLEFSICEHQISVADEIQQLGTGDFSGDTFHLVLTR